MAEPRDKPEDPRPIGAAAAAASALAKAARGADGEGPIEPVISLRPALLELKRGDLSLEEFSNQRWRLLAGHGVTAEDLDGHPGAWSLLSTDLKAFDLVIAVDRDRTWWAEFLVLDSSPGCVDVRMLRSTKVPPRSALSETRIPPGFTIRQSSPGEQEGLLVTRNKDGILMNAGQILRTREEAVRMIVDHASNRSPEGTRYLPR